MADLQVSKMQEVIRPLKILTPLIKKDFEDAEKAGRPFNEAAGEKLIEARQGHFDGNTSGFYKWAEKSFNKTRTNIMVCMAYSAKGGAKYFKNKEETKHTPKSKGGLGWTPYSNIRREWTAPVNGIAEKARREAFRLVQEDALTRAQERDAERALAHRLIDIGYKVLAKELHPDKVGGSRDAMKRLNHVRDKLKHSI